PERSITAFLSRAYALFGQNTRGGVNSIFSISGIGEDRSHGMQSQNQPASVQHGWVEDVVATANIVGIRSDHRDSKNLYLALEPKVQQPLPRAEQAGLVGNRSGVDQWTEFDLHKAGAINVFVEFPIGQEIPPAKRGVAFAIFQRAFVAAQPQIVVALHAKLEQFIQRGMPSQRAGADRATHLVVVTSRQ